jgi:hypothetical protein
MIVTDANEFAGRIHDRMPVFLAKDNILLQVWPVSKRVNRSATAGDDPTLIDRIIAVDAA